MAVVRRADEGAEADAGGHERRGREGRRRAEPRRVGQPGPRRGGRRSRRGRSRAPRPSASGARPRTTAAPGGSRDRSAPCHATRMPSDPGPPGTVVAASERVGLDPGGAREVRTDDYLLVARRTNGAAGHCVASSCSGRPAGDLVDEIVDIARGLGRTRTGWRVSDATARPTSSGSCSPRRRGSRSGWTCSALPIAHGVPDFGVPPERRSSGRSPTRRTCATHDLVSGDAFGGARVSESGSSRPVGGCSGAAPRGRGPGGAYVDGQPAGTGGWTLAGPVCRLWGGATHSAVRGRGAYRAVARPSGCERARAAGATLGLSRAGSRRRRRSCAAWASPATARHEGPHPGRLMSAPP